MISNDAVCPDPRQYAPADTTTYHAPLLTSYGALRQTIRGAGSLGVDGNTPTDCGSTGPDTNNPACPSG